MGMRQAGLDHFWDDVHAKITARSVIILILGQHLIQEPASNTYTPMEAIEVSGSPGIVGGSSGFSTKSMMRRLSSTCMTPNAEASCLGTFDTGDRHRPAQLHVIHDQRGVVHLVDVIPRQHPECTWAHNRALYPDSGTPHRRFPDTSSLRPPSCCAGSKSMNSFIW